LTKSDKQDEKKSDNSTAETIKYPQTQTPSPKRLKKIKFDRDFITARERIRSQSRQRTPNQFSSIPKQDIHMNFTYKIATLNINAISSPMKIKLLTNFLLGQDIDIALLQEVANNDLSNIYGYSAHINSGTEKRGTAILMKEGISVNNIKKTTVGPGDSWTF